VTLAIVLVVLGTALAVAEVFFVSFGVFSVASGACILIADVIAFGEGPAVGWTFVAVEIVLLPLAVWYAFRVLPRTPFGRRMVLAAPAPAGPAAAVPAFEHLVGRAGRAVTDLRPAGTALIEGERLSVVAVGGFLSAGQDVVVDSVEGVEIRVRASAPPSPDPRSRP
jgi:membrane-bound serine protease (ClpP class)